MNGRLLTLWCACCLACPVGAAFPVAGRAEQPAATEAEAFFENQVRPLLAKRCYGCHGAETQEGGLRLDSRQHLLAGTEGRPVVIAGQPDQSRLIAAVRRQGELQMPPDDRLPDAEVDALVAWVKLGLPWPQSDRDPPPALSRAERYEQDRLTHWAYQPVLRPPVPADDAAGWAQTPIDRFVLAELRAEGLTPSEPAERRVLIRRATFDLLGLPPTPDEVEAFVNDSSAEAYERVVDRLLASPRYGERWGRHWLDVARYADTKGYAFAQERRYPYSYTYRDYVIQAWNADLPYDRFLLEQLAADLLPLEPNSPRLAALGFLTVGRKFNNRHDDIDDQIDVVCRGLMGLTVCCARCHDHKYDAIPTEDYYSLYGVFASSQEPGDLPLIGRPEEVAGYEKFKQRLDELQRDLDANRAERHAALLDAARRQVAEYLVRATSARPEGLLEKLPFLSLSRDELKPKLVQRWRDYLRQQFRDDHPLWAPLHVTAGLDDAQFAATAAERLRACLERPEGTGDGQLNPLVKQALGGELPATRAELANRLGALFAATYSQWREAGGNDAAREQLSPASRQLLEVLLAAGSPTDVPLSELDGYVTRAERNKLRELQKKIDAHQVNSGGAPPRAMIVRENSQPHDPRVFIRGNQGRPGDAVPRQFLFVLAGPERQPFTQGSGRLELAQAIASEHNPLTRRVLANRIWMHHFGQPLVTTPSDFGTRSEPPRHAALLDYLAWSLAAGDWSLKALHREILLSSVYRQASLPRPDCEARDPENRLFWRMSPRRLEFEALRDALLAVGDQLDTAVGGRPVELFAPPFSRRRSVYGFIDRQDLPNLLRVFDFASPDQSTAQRPQTTVPQQALFLMNSPEVLQRAKALLARPDVAGLTDDDQRIQRLYQVLYGRPASDEEVSVGREFVRAAGDAPELSSWQQYAQLLLLSNEFVFVD
ncbi:MAG: DUF1549 domain-containing protein [Pirellulaceae bacterium]|nr:DUF1549 domain-containing protein [Pirellulaceae bacterium]